METFKEYLTKDSIIDYEKYFEKNNVSWFEYCKANLTLHKEQRINITDSSIKKQIQLRFKKVKILKKLVDSWYNSINESIYNKGMPLNVDIGTYNQVVNKIYKLTKEIVNDDIPSALSSMNTNDDKIILLKIILSELIEMDDIRNKMYKLKLSVFSVKERAKIDIILKRLWTRHDIDSDFESKQTGIISELILKIKGKLDNLINKN